MYELLNVSREEIELLMKTCTEEDGIFSRNVYELLKSFRDLEFKETNKFKIENQFLEVKTTKSLPKNLYDRSVVSVQSDFVISPEEKLDFDLITEEVFI